MAHHPADLRLYQLVLAVDKQCVVGKDTQPDQQRTPWVLDEMMEARRYLIEKGVWKIPGQEDNEL